MAGADLMESEEAKMGLVSVVDDDDDKIAILVPRYHNMMKYRTVEVRLHAI
jgi:hypothetical protein